MTIVRAVGAAMVLWLGVVHVGHAQPGDKPRVIGVLSLSAGSTLRDEVFERRLRELGWIDGQNVRFEYRRAANRLEPRRMRRGPFPW